MRAEMAHIPHGEMTNTEDDGANYVNNGNDTRIMACTPVICMNRANRA
jgi:hypothetical protein